MQVLCLALALLLSDDANFSRDLFVVKSLLGISDDQNEDESVETDLGVGMSPDEFRHEMEKMRKALAKQGDGGSQDDEFGDWM